MSRLAQRPGALAPMRGVDDGDSICPVCKSSRYLNPNMRFLVNPECYHKMCESCVDRIFSHGPAQCPVAGCKRTLRKHRFRKQTFEDIQVEREVDIRRRVAEVFNRREDEFDTLLDWNNYLEEVEGITFALVNNIDVAENERKLAAYRDHNAQSIRQNATRANDETANLVARQAAEKEQAKLRREAARREEEEERRERAEGRLQIINDLVSSEGNATKIAREGERVMLKRSSARRADAERVVQSNADVIGSNGSVSGAVVATDSSGFVFRGLKRRIEPTPDNPYDAFGGLQYDRRYYVLQDRYEWDWLDEARTNPQFTAGGYDVQEYCHRALSDAFSGLGVCIGDELAANNAAATSSVTMMGAALASVTVNTSIINEVS